MLMKSSIFTLGEIARRLSLFRCFVLSAEKNNTVMYLSLFLLHNGSTSGINYNKFEILFNNLVRLTIKKISNLRLTESFWGEYTDDRWITIIKDQQCGRVVVLWGLCYSWGCVDFCGCDYSPMPFIQPRNTKPADVSRRWEIMSHMSCVYNNCSA